MARPSQHPVQPGGHKKTSKIAKDKNHALSRLFEILYGFTDSPDRLTAEDLPHFRPEPSSTPANNPPTKPTTSTPDKP